MWTSLKPSVFIIIEAFFYGFGNLFLFVERMLAVFFDFIVFVSLADKQDDVARLRVLYGVCNGAAAIDDDGALLLALHSLQNIVNDA